MPHDVLGMRHSGKLYCGTYGLESVCLGGTGESNAPPDTELPQSHICTRTHAHIHMLTQPHASGPWENRFILKSLGSIIRLVYYYKSELLHQRAQGCTLTPVTAVAERGEPEPSRGMGRPWEA